MSKLYYSIDIETNGLTAGINSMISLGVAVIDMTNGHIVTARKWNLLPLDDLKVDQDTMNWWKGFPEAYEAATHDAIPASEAIQQFNHWVKYLCELYKIERPVCAAWKPGFDIAFIRYYLYRFVGKDIFGRGGSGLDIKTLTAAALNKPFSEVQIGTVPNEYKGGFTNHSHDAMEDATEQAYVMYNAAKKLGVNI